jgi:tetratricopeptide (TPR) repeat protein
VRPTTAGPFSRGRAPQSPLLGRAGVEGLSLWISALLIAAIVCFTAFYAKARLDVESTTTTEIVLTLLAGVTIAVAALLAPSRRRLYGIWPFVLLLGFTALTTLSIVWSVQPDDSWHDANRMLAYSAVFGAAVALARLVPRRWPAVIGGLALASVVVCGYALLTKVFPSLAPSVTYARLEEPFEYWNAVGLTAAMGAICCMWLGARRSGHALLSALAYPAMGLLLLTLLLAYSRGALAALAVGLVLWFCVVPLRLRGAAVLIVGGIGAGAMAAWDFSRHALSAEGVSLAQRSQAGHQLGALLLAMLVLLSIAGIAIGFATDRRHPSVITRRRAGAALLALIAIAIVAFAGALAHSQRGLTGSVSHAYNNLTNPNAPPPPNTAGRLTAVASVRARYWKEALDVFKAHPLLGAGAEGYATARLRYRTATLEVQHAHGFVVQTLADLGLIGLALALALLLSWMAAAGRATHPFNRRWTSTLSRTGWRVWTGIGRGEGPGWRRLSAAEMRGYPPERIGMLSMLCLVVVFGVHSLIDWTWYVPGDACVALLCAGWLAGRGPLRVSTEAERADAGSGPAMKAEQQKSGWRAWQAGLRPSYARSAVAVAAIVAALLAAWSQWQPLRSEDAQQEALSLLEHNPSGALAAAHTGVARDPLSAEALSILAEVQNFRGQDALARDTLNRAVRLQPSNPKTWLSLARFDLTHNDPSAAVQELQATIYLNPELLSTEALSQNQAEAVEVHNDYIDALRATAAAAVKSASESRSAKAHASRLAHRRHSSR